MGAFVASLRPRQWVKNVFIFAPAVFALHLLDPRIMSRAFLAFALFSLVTGAIYVFNDVVDRAADRLHPEKRRRPIAAGRIAAAPALAGAVALLAAALLGAWLLQPAFFLDCLVYAVLNVLYSLLLKRVVVVDILVIAAGFVLRVIAGGAVDAIPVSPWILIATFLLSIFLALVKRRQELRVLLTSGSDGAPTRRTLQEYSLAFLDQMIGVTTAATLIAYVMYVLSPEVQAKFGSHSLFYTIPFVVFGLFRYLYLTYIRNQGENAAEVIYTDPPFTLNLVLWVIVFILLVFRRS